MASDTNRSIEEQFLQAYDAYADAIFRHCYFRVFSRELAMDLMQESFTRTWAYLADGKTVENLRAFIYRVANNLIIDGSRKHKEVSLDVLQEKGFDPATPRRKEGLQNITDGKYAIEKLRLLDPKYRTPISMRYIDDLTPKEIAQILGESENIVSVHIHRGMEQLRQKFEL
ncbi:MAG: RNA polymerase sigma factor [bacterium]|nr:RNA polymerase sigma factor [bacterium]